jgi:hypothetical protein
MLLDRFDREEMAPPGDAAWLGWQDAIAYLGLKDFESRVQLGWKAGRIIGHNDADHRAWLSQVDWAAAHSDDQQYFIDDHVVPITDPIVSLAWMAEPRRVRHHAAQKSDDPAVTIKLTENELDWLGGFLICDQAPEAAMSLEELDGYFSALVAGPELVLPSAYMPRLWGTDKGEGPVYDSLEQAQFVSR